MSKLRLTISVFAFLLLIQASSSTTHASFTPPTFPNCPNPGGVVLVSYPDGLHGIVGQTDLVSGSDVVYTINSTQVVQCFCPATGAGIQTSWLKVSEVSQPDLATLQNLGWIIVPDGSAWGLDPAVYIAKNDMFSCQGGNGGGSSGGTSPASAPVCDSAKPPAPVLKSVTRTGTTATLTWTPVDQATHYLIFYGTQPGKWDFSVPNTGKVTTFTIGGLNPNQTYYYEVRSVNNCAPSDSPAIGGGSVLGLSTTSFAPTGNLAIIVALFVLGSLLTATAVLGKLSRSFRE